MQIKFDAEKMRHNVHLYNNLPSLRLLLRKIRTKKGSPFYVFDIRCLLVKTGRCYGLSLSKEQGFLL